MEDFLHNTSNWVLVSFAIFAVIGYKFGKDKFLSLLDTRIESIKNDIETAENLRVEAQQLLAQYERKQRDAQQEAERIVKSAKDHAMKIKKQAEDELEEAMQRREEQLKTRLQRMEEEAIQEIRAYASELAVKATTEIINDNFSKSDNSKLVNATIKDVKDQLAS